jgi:hypothetical protein
MSQCRVAAATAPCQSASRRLLPTYEANHAHVLSRDVIAVDETWWRLMKKGASKRWWVWSVARVMALFYSLIESAKLCAVEPRAYLREAALRAVRNSGTVTLARDLKSPKF